MAVVLLTLPPTHWVCPNCSAEESTSGDVQNRFHECRALAGITAPMVPAGDRSRVIAVEREDYVGRADVQRDGNGRPISAVVTERPDGSNDTLILAPTVHMVIETY